MAWFKRQAGELDTSGERKVRTEGLWVKCDTCRQIIWKKDLEENLNVCPKCDRHFRIDARTRLAQLLDDNEYEVSDANLASTDPLKFVDLKAYSARLKQAQADTGLKDAVINARGKLNGRTVIVSSMEYAFIGGSMGAVVGEAITRAIEQATETKVPIVIVSASGGARMMEGVISLMQLAKISAALARLDEAKVPFISILTDPTTGGVTASFAMLGDLNIAEPGALIGFAGPRVIEQTIRQKLPQGFQRSEFLLEHGMLDAVVHRRQMKSYISRALDFMDQIAQSSVVRRQHRTVVSPRSSVFSPSQARPQLFMSDLVSPFSALQLCISMAMARRPKAEAANLGLAEDRRLKTDDRVLPNRHRSHVRLGPRTGPNAFAQVRSGAHAGLAGRAGQSRAAFSQRVDRRDERQGIDRGDPGVDSASLGVADRALYLSPPGADQRAHTDRWSSRSATTILPWSTTWLTAPPSAW